MTAMACYSAWCDVIQPIIILSGIKNVLEHLVQFEDNAIFTSSQKGWITSQLWEAWNTNFVLQINLN